MKKFGRNLLVAVMLTGSIVSYGQSTSTSAPPSSGYTGTDPMPPTVPPPPPSSVVIAIVLSMIGVVL